jgi:hypothetical protein
MPYSLSVWLDDPTAKALELLCLSEERKRGDMVKVLIRQAAREKELMQAKIPNTSRFHAFEGLETENG